MRRRNQSPNRRLWLRTAAAALALGLGAGAGVLLAAAPAGAAPKPNYHSGSDTATFTVTGVLDRNCKVSTGGTAIWIRPGDSIKFDSALAGIEMSKALPNNPLGGLLGRVLRGTDVAGLNISATIDGNTSHPQKFTVRGDNTTNYPGSTHPALSAGNHTIHWRATGLALVPGLSKTSIPLSSSDLKSGANLSWTGAIHVTTSAPRCKLAVATPKTKISAGPVHVTVPGVTVTPPVSVPSLNPLPASGSGNGGGTKPHPRQPTSAPPKVTHSTVLPVPAMVVPQGDSGGYQGGGGYLGARAGSLDRFGNAAVRPANATAPGASSNAAPTQPSTGKHKTIDLAANKAPSAQLPVILAIIAIIALSLVAATYARLYLLRRGS